MSEISRVALFGKLNSLGYKAIESATVFCKLRGNPYVDLVHWIGDFQGKTVATVAAGGVPIFTADLGRPIALIIGNEGAGVSAGPLAVANLRVTIPMPGGFESLNAAAATAIALFECVRRVDVG